MEHLIDALLMLALVLGFVCLGFRQVYRCIVAVAIQGVVTGILLMLAHLESLDPLLIGVAVASILVKGLAVPVLLARSAQRQQIEQRIEPYLGFNTSMLIGTLGFGGALWLAASLKLPYAISSDLVVPISLATVFIGLVALVSRRKAVTQVVAYLVLDNGIFMFGLVLVPALPVLVEMGVLLDLFAAVFVMGVTIHNINRQFDHIDTSRMSQLNDLVPGLSWGRWRRR